MAESHADVGTLSPSGAQHAQHASGPSLRTSPFTRYPTADGFWQPRLRKDRNVGPSASSAGSIARALLAWTVPRVPDRLLLSRLLTTPWLASFVGRAHEGDQLTSNFPARCAAWAHWAVGSLEEFQGNADRTYVGIALPGEFYQGRPGIAPDVRPHLEVPARTLAAPDALFPERLALAGNTLLFRWWVASEVIAARRAMFTPGGDISPLVSYLGSYSDSLAQATSTLSAEISSSWSSVSASLAGDRLSDELTGDFSTSQVADLVPFAEELGLQVDFDSKLRQGNGPFASRRVGVWLVRGSSPSSGEFSLGVVTPRLGSSGPVSDGLFSPLAESGAALLVRCLVMRRLARSVGIPSSVSLLRPDSQEGPRPYLRAIVAKAGAKVPEASTDAAVHFLHTYPEVSPAWDALQQWAGGEYLLTVSHESFTAAHVSARRHLRRGETPSRDDINVLLPLAWDSKSRVVRATFSRAADDTQGA